MRGLFFLLLVLNLVYLLYGLVLHRQDTGHEIVVMPRQLDGVPLLKLLNDEPSPVNVGMDGESGEGRLSCVSLGPFNSSQETAALQAGLSREGVAFSLLPLTESRPISYWVVLEPSGGRAGARAAVGTLTARGMNDHYIISDGPYRDGLSLGLFSEHARALTRLEQVRGVGLEPVIKTRYREVPVYWLEVEMNAGSLAGLSLPLPAEVVLVERPCTVMPDVGEEDVGADMGR
ncbi:hypothetical protein CKO35_10575 [Ectothiorhodospira shaposhnikovii]|uniref:hypothetical protein n=1 Tax=Ectothiorhodospira shaposhnikovii TaxID=1054 RepID=UPI001904BD9B|nr:hypothetical protein [Ectothiorhodospira shaposhnikovii]MBK1673745.1 hypothetical protein [Ectothiorhodospira shaposhnikovii]